MINNAVRMKGVTEICNNIWDRVGRNETLNIFFEYRIFQHTYRINGEFNLCLSLPTMKNLHGKFLEKLFLVQNIVYFLRLKV